MAGHAALLPLLALLVLVVVLGPLGHVAGQRRNRRPGPGRRPAPLLDASAASDEQPGAGSAGYAAPSRLRPSMRRAINRARLSAALSQDQDDIDLPPEQLQQLQARQAGRDATAVVDPFSQLSAEQGVRPGSAVSALPDGITFHVFTRAFGDNPGRELRLGDEASLAASGFRAGRPTKVLIHGFSSNVNRTMMTIIKDAYLEAMDVNVVSVDWSPLSAAPWYRTARTNVEVVGPRLAALLDWLARHGAGPGSVHLVGHSLGAHVAGIAGATVRSGRVARISGLDPARPGFRDVDLRGRLDPSDAVLVDVVHTCGGLLGQEQPVGHIDYYPNGGHVRQPGCVTDLGGFCSHEKAFKIWRDSIADVDFPARRCASYQEALSGVGCSGAVAMMGEHGTATPPGIYFSVTA